MQEFEVVNPHSLGKINAQRLIVCNGFINNQIDTPFFYVEKIILDIYLNGQMEYVTLQLEF